MFDDVVRPRYQQLLWEALGRPARMTVPLGHYTSALALGPILNAVSDFFVDRAIAKAAERRAGPAAGRLARWQFYAERSVGEQ